MNLRVFGIVLYLAIFGGAIGLFGKLALADFSPTQLIFMRLFISLIFLGAIFAYQNRLRQVIRTVFHHWLDFISLALSGVGGGMVVGFLGLSRTTAVDYGLLFNISAVFIVAFAVPLLHETVRLRDSLLLGVALFGAALIVTEGNFSYGFLRNENLIGNILIICAAAGWGFYSVRGVALGRENKDINSSVCVFGSFIFGSLALLPYIIFLDPFRAVSFTNLGAVSAALALAILATAILFYLWFEFINREGGLLAGFVALLENIGGAIFPVIFLREKLTGPIVLGGIIIIIALAVQDYLARRARRYHLTILSEKIDSA